MTKFLFFVVMVAALFVGVGLWANPDSETARNLKVRMNDASERMGLASAATQKAVTPIKQGMANVNSASQGFQQYSDRMGKSK